MSNERAGRKNRKRRERTGKRVHARSGAAVRAAAADGPEAGSGMATMLRRYLRGRSRNDDARDEPTEAQPADTPDPKVQLFRDGDYDAYLERFEADLAAGSPETGRTALMYARACLEKGIPERLVETARRFSRTATWGHHGFRTRYFQALLALDRAGEAVEFVRQSVLVGRYDLEFLHTVIAEHRSIGDDALVGGLIDLAHRTWGARIKRKQAIFFQNISLTIGAPLDALRFATPARVPGLTVDDHFLLANWCTISGDHPAALVHFNRGMSRHGISPVRLKDPKRPLAVTNLTSRASAGVREGPLVTVVMPTFNAAETVLAALASLSGQSYRDLEILVVDDGSSDDTAALVSRYAAEVDDRVRLLAMAQNGGAYRARNRALAEARGVFFTCNDSDDWSHPGKIAALVDILAASETTIAARSSLVRLSPEIGIKPKRAGYVHPDLSSTLFRREPVIERIGYYQPVRFGADSEYLSRMAHAFGEAAMAELDKPYLIAHWSSESLSGRRGTGISDGGMFYARRAAYRHDYRARHRRGEGIRIERADAGIDGPAPPPDPRQGWSLEGTTLFYREGKIELFWRMPEGFAMPSNALLSLAEAVLFAPYGRRVQVEPAARREDRLPGRVAVAYSGGIDSSAALRLLPDPIPIYTQVSKPVGRHVIENALLAVEEVGGISIVSNYDTLPLHFDQRRGFFGFAGFTVTAILLADHLNITTIADGNTIDTIYLFGEGGHGTRYNPAGYPHDLGLFRRAGLEYCAPCAGLTEVWTDLLTRDRVFAMGCMRGSGGKPCLQCPKCYRKSALRGTPIAVSPAAEHALGREPIRMLGALLWARDHRGLRHPRLDDVDKDISWTDKWYPRSIEFVPEDLREYFLGRLAHYGIAPLENLTPLETWDARRQAVPLPADSG